MSLLKTAIPVVAVAAGLTAGVVGLGAPASAQPPPPPPAPALPAESPGPAPRPMLGDPVPPNAPPKPAEFWLGEPVVWFSGWGGRWGVWKNGAFIHLSKNIVTGGG
ncbi:hypothetical protein [Mycolicibacterium sp. GF69]|uniref:hypothetical protein n=1 Tax=Mycolicibacterium sp. GF69 TaxID=2267251 RepID=UPI00197C7527|nr:hypothetical protein [Mycolicibacterium sp. GF69]